jgi:hypothetical protein
MTLVVMDITPQILNAALRAYVRTFRSHERLMEHISAAGLTGHNDEIVAKLDAVLEAAEDLLYSFPGALPRAFERDYYASLVEQHSWLDTESLSRIHEFLGWLSWHEGLNAW